MRGRSNPVWLSRARGAAALFGSVALHGCTAPTATAVRCEELPSFMLEDGRITDAQAFAAAEYTPPEDWRRAGEVFEDLPAFCRVKATLEPTTESAIHIEVWLPQAGWNGKLLAVGNGGWSGSIYLHQLAEGLRRGYAVTGTDTGHTGGGGPWMGNREKLIDFGHRAVHEMRVRTTDIATAYYAAAPRLTYFNGCSGGGRQGMKAAQMYPDDFDGIIAGAPALHATGRATFAIWIAQNMHRTEESYIPPEKYPAIHSAVLDACDALDGVVDGVLEDPRSCTFDPGTLACDDGDAATCLTPSQVQAARAMYAPIRNPRTGAEVTPGLTPGSELGWERFGGPEPMRLGMQMFQHMVFGDVDWDFRTLNFDEDMETVSRVEDGIVDATDPDLAAFAASGGKLLMYHGWSDPQIPALRSVRYYERVLDAFGSVEETQEHARLFMMPGIEHCGGGAGVTSYDMLATLEAWVERAEVPERIVASRELEGGAKRMRPFCPYPETATYIGSGSTDDAENFVCEMPGG